MSASIVTLKDGQTENIQYPKTVKSALMKDDGTPLNPIEPSQIINDITTGGVAVPLSAQQGVVLDNKISTTDSKIGILSALTTIDKTSVVGAINENSSAIGQLQTDMGNIDVSWDGITGKPTTFAPSTHTHTKADVGLGSVLNYDIATQAEVDAATSNVKYVTPLGLAGLKSSVVNGKQEVVNAINGSLGYNSGLTTSHTHGDYAWWIQNKVTSTFPANTMLYNYGVFSNGFTSQMHTSCPVSINADNIYIQLSSSTLTFQSPITSANGVVVTMAISHSLPDTLAYIGPGYSSDNTGTSAVQALKIGQVDNSYKLNEQIRYFSYYIPSGTRYIYFVGGNAGRFNIYSIGIKYI